MNSFLPHAFPILLWTLCACLPMTGLAAEIRVFTDKTGRTLKAEFVAMKGNIVTLKREDGQIFTMSLGNFSETDSQYLRQQKVLAETTRPGLASQEPAPLDSVVIEALIDGPSELRVKKNGLYWINGGNAKPGRHFGQELATYVDGKPWRPNWKEPGKDRGIDRSTTKSVEGVDPQKIEFKLLNVTPERGEPGIISRDPIQVRKIEDELSITIPDTQGGSMWYRFALVKKP